MNRINQIVLIASFAAFSWLGMQAVHELGHVLGAVATGGRVTRVVLHPFAFSRTDVDPNTHPLFVVWAGPVAGTLLPLSAVLLACAMRWPGVYLFSFFAGFCLIANGGYIGIGSVPRIADAGDMLRYGAARRQLILFGLAATALGLYLWNGLGPKFGMGTARGAVDRRAALTSLVLLLLLAGAELAAGSR